jgi:hypothetical protein
VAEEKASNNSYLLDRSWTARDGRHAGTGYHDSLFSGDEVSLLAKVRNFLVPSD